MRWFHVFTAGLLCAAGALSGAESAVFFTEKFDGPFDDHYTADRNCTARIITAEGGGKELEITGGMATRWIAIPPGKILEFSARVKGDRVTPRDPANSAQGARFGSFCSTPRKIWKAARLPSGTFDWQPVTFRVEPPVGPTEIQLQLGLKDASGTVRFREIAIAAIDRPAESEETPPPGAIFRERFDELSDAYRTGGGTHIALVGSGAGKALEITGGMATRWLTVPDGKTLRFSALAQGEKIERRDRNNSAQGGRFGSFYTKPANTWNSGKVPDGTFDWTPVGFQINVPAGTTRVQLQLGLKDATGTIRFKDIRIDSAE